MPRDAPSSENSLENISNRSFSEARNTSGIRPFNGSAPAAREKYMLPGQKSKYGSFKHHHEDEKYYKMGEDLSDNDDEADEEEHDFHGSSGFNLKPAK